MNNKLINNQLTNDKLIFTELIITKRNNKIISCLLEDHKALSLRCCEPTASLIGNIYIGRVQTVVKNINAAFIEIEKGLPCYLSLADCKNPILCNREYNGKLVQGDELLVQVVRDRIKTKDPVVTTNLSFSGRYSVISTGNTHIGYSKHLSHEEKQRLKEITAPYLEKKFGYIMRTNVATLLHGASKNKKITEVNKHNDTKKTKNEDNISERDKKTNINSVIKINTKEEIFVGNEDILIKELQNLTTQCKHIISIAKTRTLYSCLFETLPDYILEVRDTKTNIINTIVTDDTYLYQQLDAFMTENQLHSECQLTLYEDTSYSLSKLIGLEKIIDHVLSKKVWLKSGGYLIIEPTEALIVIDVNTGKYSSKKSMEETFYKINIEAAIEAARQMRLRNLSGIIIIDFINMDNPNDNQKLLDTLNQTCIQDPIKTCVVDMTALGLVEITRKRIHPPLIEQLKE